MRGPYDEQLRAVLLEATKRNGCDQVSLATALKRDQTTVGKYIRNVAGAPLDLDSAHVALRHCGLGGLREFVTDAPVPPDTLPSEVLSFLREHDGFTQLLRDLLAVPRGGHAKLLELFQILVRQRMTERKAGRPPGTTKGRRTTKE